MPRSPDRRIPGSYGRDYPWPMGQETDPMIDKAAKEFYKMWKDLFETRADFTEQERMVDLFYESHKENGVTEWMQSVDKRWKLARAPMLKQKAHQDWQKEHGKRF